MASFGARVVPEGEKSALVRPEIRKCGRAVEQSMTESEWESTEPVALPERIVERVEARLPYTEFDDVSDYVTYVMEEVLATVEERDTPADPVDEDEVRRRLESLGYLE